MTREPRAEPHDTAAGPATVPAASPDAAAPDVSVIVVSYNTRVVLEDCLASLLASRGTKIETFVVDNASPDGSADMVAAAFPEAILIRNPSNRGFAAANNLAIRRARGRYVLLLNPDTIVRPDTIATLASFLDAAPDVGITGPRVLNPDGSPQSCGYWYPTLAGELRMSRQVERMARLALGQPRPTPDTTRTTDVEWVDGCCLLIRRAVIDRIGALDEQFFLYAEELDWCRSARTAGWRIATCPAAAMTHLGGQSSTQVKASALALLTETRLRYYRKHDGLPIALLVSMVYALGCLRQWSTERDKSRAKLRGIRQWLRALAGRTAHAVPAVAAPGASLPGTLAGARARGRDAA